MVGRGSAVADVDGDGALDLFIVDLDGRARLFRNRIGAQHSWIEIAPRSGDDGRSVLGTKVRLTSGGRTQTQWYQVSASYASGSLVPLHFGLGDADRAEEIEIVWPGGVKQTLRGLPARRAYAIRPGEEPQPLAAPR
jgi:hypothetical protein